MRQRTARYGRIAPAALTVASVAGGISSPGAVLPRRPRPRRARSPGRATPAGTWAVPERRPRQHAGRRRVADLVGERRLAARGVDVQAHRHRGDRGERRRLVRRRAGRGERRRVPAGPVRQRVRDLAGHREAASGSTRSTSRRRAGPAPTAWRSANGVVYGDTSTTVFALNAATGKVIWNDSSLLNSGQGSFEIQPPVAGGRVYLASAYGSGPGGGVLLALDAATGKVLWRFNTVVGAEPGRERARPRLRRRLGDAAGRDGRVGDLRDREPVPVDRRGDQPPGGELYTDSEVNLDAATGKLRWYYQAVPNDFKDWDMQLSPIAATVGGVPAIIGGGKMGNVYAMNAVDRRAAVEDAGRRAQRDRQRLARCCSSTSSRSSCPTRSSPGRSAACSPTWRWRTAACTWPRSTCRSSRRP